MEKNRKQTAATPGIAVQVTALEKPNNVDTLPLIAAQLQPQAITHTHLRTSACNLINCFFFKAKKDESLLLFFLIQPLHALDDAQI